MRQPAVDTAKFILVGLVVVGHLVEASRSGQSTMQAAYRFIYLFHVPALVYVSGIFATTRIDVDQARRWLATLVLPLLVFQILYLLAVAYLQDKPFALRLATPYWLLWYLASLACWRLLLPAVMSLRHPLLVTAALAIAIGYVQDVGYTWSASRTFVFLPFFVAGHCWGLPRPRRVLPLLTLTGLILVAWFLRDLPTRWFYGSTPYAQPIEGAIRAGLLMSGALGVWAILSLVPRRDGSLARLGRHSIAPYLLHGFLVKAMPALGLAVPFAGAPRLLVCVLAGGLLTWVLTWVGRLVWPLMDYRWLLGGKVKHSHSDADSNDSKS